MLNKRNLRDQIIREADLTLAKKSSIGIVTGGWTGERKISERGAKLISKKLNELGFEINVCEVRSIFDVSRVLQLLDCDVVIPALTEEVPVQAACEAAGIDYVGSGPLATALSYNKNLTKIAALGLGIQTPDYIELSCIDDFSEDALAWSPEYSIVKPVFSGCSVDTYLVRSAKKVRATCEDVLQSHPAVLVERYVAGRDFTTVFYDNHVLATIEQRHTEDLYSYEVKTSPRPPEYIIETNTKFAPIINKFNRLSKAFGCRGIYRFDFRVDAQGEPHFLEINTLPYLPEGEVPAAAAAFGISVEQLLLSVIWRASTCK